MQVTNDNYVIMDMNEFTGIMDTMTELLETLSNDNEYNMKSIRRNLHNRNYKKVYRAIKRVEDDNAKIQDGTEKLETLSLLMKVAAQQL